MAGQPIISWFDATNTTQQTVWDAGVVAAGSKSNPVEFLIWNNRSTSPGTLNTDVPDMTDVKIIPKSLAGDDTGPVASKSDATVQVSFNNNGTWTDFQDIGGGVSATVIARNGVVGTISGKANTADKNTNTANYADIKLQLYVQNTQATAGQVQWYTRITYNYQ
jgi:hypothetical protein